MSTTVTHESDLTPRITLTREDGGGYRATIEIDGLDVQRTTSVDERAAGIVSLDPPTVRIKPHRRSTVQHRRLIAAAQRAVTAACTSTTGETGGPGAILMTHMRVALGMRSALRLLDEQI